MKKYVSIRREMEQASRGKNSRDRIGAVLDVIIKELPFRRMAVLLFREGKGDGISAYMVASSGLSRAESKVLENIIIPVNEKDGLLANAFVSRSVRRADGRQLPRGLMNDSKSVAILPLHMEDSLVSFMSQKGLLPSTEEGAFGVVVGELADDAWQSEAIMELLTVISNDIASSTVNAKLQEVMLADTEQSEREMIMALGIQQALLPRDLPRLPGLELCASSHPAKEVGGDFYHFIPLRGKGSKLGILIGDAAGKGAPAAMLMAAMTSTIGQLARRTRNPARVLAKANRFLLSRFGNYSPYVVTAFYGILDINGRTLTYANAGHVPPIHYRNKDKTCAFLPGPGMLLGSFLDCRLENRTVELSPGDKIVFYTDGINDARNLKGEFYGEGRLPELVQRNGQKSAQELLNLVQEDIAAHLVGFQPQHDDITLVVCAFKPEQNP
jgi:serine phosphatase RsbU (regulator of sigma subunit)